MFHAYDILPTPAPRQVRRDKWNPSGPVRRYRAFRDEVRLKRVQLPDPYHVVFVLPMPKSWSARRRADAAWTLHRQKPDRDNLEKALLDAVFGDDAHVADGRTTKVWGHRGAILVGPLSPVYDGEELRAILSR